ncbi:DnaJ-like protein subfamily C member 19 [Pancytospora philotis]|nr:DnaJ-like protein subfamily C member 19 [Pancytospora philotis]
MLMKYLRGLAGSAYTVGFGEMTYRKSCQILNIGAGDSVVERYRRMARINHPDLGGSPYLLEKINQAKQYIEAYNSRL